MSSQQEEPLEEGCTKAAEERKKKHRKCKSHTPIWKWIPLGNKYQEIKSEKRKKWKDKNLGRSTPMINKLAR